MHSSPLDIYEKMNPNLAIISTTQEVSTKQIGGMTLERGLFPHPSSISSLEEVGATILTTDGWYESTIIHGQPRNPKYNRCGTIVVALPPGGNFRYDKLDDDENTVKNPPMIV